MKNKIVWFVQRLDQVGGGERFAIESALTLQQMNTSAILVCEHYSDLATFNGKYDLSEVVTIGRVDYFGKTYFGTVLNKLASTVKLYWTLKKISPESVVVQSEPDAIKVYLLSKLIGFKYRVFIFGQMFQFATDITKYSSVFIKHCETIINSRPGYQSIIPWPAPKMSLAKRIVNNFLSFLKLKAVQNAEAIYTLSEQVKWEVELLYNRKASVLIGSFHESYIKQERLTTPSIKKDRVQLVTLSRLVDKKRVEIIIEATNHLNIDFELVIMGKGPEEERLKKIAANSRNPEKIQFLGAVSDAEIERRFKESDIFLSMDIGDFDISVIEGLANGLKVIVPHDFDSRTFQIKDEGVYIVDALPKAVAEAIEKAASTTAPLSPYLPILKNFTWENLASNIIKEI